MPCQSHPPWLHHSNYTGRRVQVMKLLRTYNNIVLVITFPSFGDWD
jgi:hypothetical protein